MGIEPAAAGRSKASRVRPKIGALSPLEALPQAPAAPFALDGGQESAKVIAAQEFQALMLAFALRGGKFRPSPTMAMKPSLGNGFLRHVNYSSTHKSSNGANKRLKKTAITY